MKTGLQERQPRGLAALLTRAAVVFAFARGVFHALPQKSRTHVPTDGHAAPLPEPGSEEPNRAADRDLQPVSGPAAEERERSGTIFVAIAFCTAVAAAVGFLFIYWTSGNNLLLGGMMGVCLVAFGCALVLWSHRLMRQREATEPRQQLKSNRTERDAAFRDLFRGEREIKRRGLLKGLIIAVMASFAAVVISFFRSLGALPGPSLKGATWKRGQRLMTVKGEPISVDTLQPGDTMTVFPEGNSSINAQAVLIRVHEPFLRLPKERAGWAPMGYVAYSRVCTHAGCPVGEFEKTRWLLLCPCHQSTFTVLDAAKPMAGPAARALPQLPLYVDENKNLRAAGDFNEPPGPGFWSIS